MTHSFLAHLSYSLKLPLQRIKKKKNFIIFPLPIPQAALLNRRNDVGSFIGTGSEFLFCTELHWPLVDACHNTILCWLGFTVTCVNNLGEFIYNNRIRISGGLELKSS